MDNKTTAQKIIFFVLDMLLLMGAIVAILTIDGGRWIISNPAFYQPPEEVLNDTSLIPNTGAQEQRVQDASIGAGITAPVKPLSQTVAQPVCPFKSQPASPEW